MALLAKLKKIWQAYKKLDEALYPLIGLQRYEKYLEHFNKTPTRERILFLGLSFLKKLKTLKPKMLNADKLKMV
ncbi:hypothetical protein CFF27374_00395 [Campylobacter fetus subsp. fetus]|nr:hypothetical protein CFF27374_00395 [Campylobacter fetus subsp. fetus]